MKKILFRKDATCYGQEVIRINDDKNEVMMERE